MNTLKTKEIQKPVVQKVAVNLLFHVLNAHITGTFSMGSNSDPSTTHLEPLLYAIGLGPQRSSKLVILCT